MSEFKLPTEVIELPSKGLVYPKDNPLSSGQIEMKYMTAKEEDILTNQSYIQKGTVLDELMKSLIVSKVNYRDLVVGDRNAVMVAARVLGYGKDYSFTYGGQSYNVDLTTLDNRKLDIALFEEGKNEFKFTTPASGTELTFKLLTGHDEAEVQKELEGLRKINADSIPELSTRLKFIITSVEGKTDMKSIREFVDNYLLARDSRALRQYIAEIQPDVDLTFKTSSGQEVAIPIGLNFFWPDL